MVITDRFHKWYEAIIKEDFMRLQTKMILLICSLLLLIIVVLGFFFQHMLATTLKEHIGTRALKLAETVASIPEIKEAFYEPEPWKIIQPMVERIRIKTDAEFIVIGNKDGIRYSHPIPERIGKEMVGGDNGPTLEGKSIISEAVGTLGPSLRGKVPIFDNQDRVIGIVSVGFLIQDINTAAVKYRNKIIFLGTITLIIGMIGALLIAHSVKRAIFGLEPEEISTLYQEKKAILESIREGIIAVNTQGLVTMANQTAVKLLGLPDGTNITGKSLFDILPTSRLLEVIKSGNAEFDQEMLINGNIVVANRLPILDHHERVIGAVSSFRNKSELYRLTEELSEVKGYAEALRAQTHEYSNKLYMISGLIQLESYQEAIEVITRESDVHQNLVNFIMKEIPDPIIGGLLIGKFNRANELKVKFEIDHESSFHDIPDTMDRNHIVTIIGNLIENAMEAVLDSKAHGKKVHVFMTDLGDDLIIEVEDTGAGIPDEYGDKIFEVGFSTKDKKNRGIGLALVKQAADQLNGYITYNKSHLEGTNFTVAIPKKTGSTVSQEAG
jgi:two-component system CitB family sensor kinase